MADNEIYRIDIPIIVDDQTEGPLRRASERVSRFEQSARKANERIRRDFQRISKLQIEPIMKVRDQLTANVLKADKLIRRLDTAQASPLIAAQDRVSAVVMRINAMLDALDKGQVDIVADMKGPLLDEIIKAKKSLSELNHVKAGPIAELRGQLFGQLTKAMSQIKALDLARAQPQITLRDRVSVAVSSITSKLKGLTSRTWNVTLQVKDKVTGFISNLIGKLTSPLALLGAGAGITGAIVFPLKLAGEFEQARMSLDFFMGGVEKGKKAFQDLVEYAAKTPFEFSFLQSAIIQLMGAGYSFEQAKRALTAFGDAAGRTGAGMQGIENALLGFTQIASSGTLTLQDLRQIALNLRVPLNMFAKELGVAESEMGEIGKKAIPAQKAMEAIVRSLENSFGGGMKQLSNSLLGLVSTIKDTAELTVWHFGKGMAEPVKRILSDIIGLTGESGGKFEQFQQTLERAGEAVGRRFEQVYQYVKQFFSDLTNTPGWDEMSWAEKVTVALNRILEAVNKWLSGPGGEMIKKTGEILGSLLAAGLEGALPNIVPVAVNLGLAIGKGILSGIWKALTSNPVVGAILGALGGAKLGAMAGTMFGLPGVAVGAVGGAVVGGGVALIKKAVSKKHQYGGILSHPHIGLVAEAGPEAIIPLSPRFRNRARSLYQRVGNWIGTSSFNSVPLLVGAGGYGGNISISTGPITAQFNITTSSNPDDVINAIREKYEDLVDELSEAIADGLNTIYSNMPRRMSG